MPVIKTQDRAQEFRISIEGRLAGECVQEVASVWAAALAKALPRKTVVDISYLTGYDTPGCKLLRQMSNHGTVLAASTSASLVLLAEITSQGRRTPELVRQPNSSSRETVGQLLKMRAGGGS